jgi:cytochrome bd ubiquinol oxidase subunit II
LQAVSYEFRSKAGNLFGKRTYEVFLFINGIGIFLLGVVVATLFTGANFTVDKNNLTQIGMPVISSWANSWHGLEALANVRNLLLGFGVVFLARVLAELYFIQTINDAVIRARSQKFLLLDTALFLVFFLSFLVWTLFAKGYTVDPQTGVVSEVAGKYGLNFLQMPVVAGVFLIGVVSLLYGIIRSLLKSEWTNGIWYSGTGTVLAVLGLFLVAGWNHTAYYPSTVNMQHSLTIENSSSSLFTLQVMSVVSLMIPFVLLYIFKAWKAVNNKPIDKVEMMEKGHKY